MISTQVHPLVHPGKVGCFPLIFPTLLDINEGVGGVGGLEWGSAHMRSCLRRVLTTHTHTPCVVSWSGFMSTSPPNLRKSLILKLLTWVEMIQPPHPRPHPLVQETLCLQAFALRFNHLHPCYRPTL